MTREELWDAFTDLDEDEMADVVMNVTNVRVFKKKILMMKCVVRICHRRTLRK
nr:MAG TPA: hypothetical protein [Caudoviricetes sp.]